MDIIDAFFNFDILSQSWPLLIKGIATSLMLSVLGIPLGFAAGMILALLSTCGHRGARFFCNVWVDLFRSLPPLVLLILLFAGLPFIGIELSAVSALIVVFFLNSGSYYGEILRAGIESIPLGQIEAARSTGLSQQKTMAYVVLPQAVRNVLPDLISNTLEVVKLTSIASVVAIPELLFQARQVQNFTYNATPLMAAAVLYFVLLWPFVRMLSRFEHRAIAGRY